MQKIIYSSFILFISMFVILLNGQNTVYSYNKSDFLSSIKSLKNYDINSKKDILRNYCNIVLSTKEFSNKSFIYNAKKSVFVYNMCTSFDFSGKADYGSKFGDKFKKYIGKKYKNLSDRKLCNYISGSVPKNNCLKGNFINFKIGEYSIHTYNEIVNALYNLKLVDLFPEDIKTFSDTYFGKGKDVCGTDKSYLNKSKISDKSSNHCSHPKTYEKMKKYIENVKTIKESKVKLFNQENVLGKNHKIKLYGKAFGKKDHSQGFQEFRNIVLNEMMFYNIFINYFIFYKSEFMTSNEISFGNSFTKNSAENAAELQRLRQEILKSRKAMKKADKMLADVYYTFPIHIGLNAYYEDLVNFRKKLVKIYTPFHQLYYKLRNVKQMN